MYMYIYIVFLSVQMYSTIVHIGILCSLNLERTEYTNMYNHHNNYSTSAQTGIQHTGSGDPVTAQNP